MTENAKTRASVGNENNPSLATSGSPSLVKPISLAQFIEDNHKILSVLGIFTALSVFSSNLAVKPVGGMLSFMFLTLTVLIWLEIWQRFPSKGGTGRLYWFENILSYTIFVVLFYWLLEFRRVTPAEWIVLLVFFVVLGATSSILKRFDVFNRLFHTQSGSKKWLRILLGLILMLFIFYLSLRVANATGPRVGHFLDRVRDELEKTTR